MPLAPDISPNQSSSVSKDLPPLPNEPLDTTMGNALPVCFSLRHFLFIYSSIFSFLNTFKMVPLPKSSVTPELRIVPIAWILVTPPLLFPFWKLNLFLDNPEVSIIAAEGIACPTSVRLPYALIPGMDLSSAAYQKATALLSKVANEAASQLPASTGARLIPVDFGK